MWDMKEVIVIAVVVGALSAIVTGFEKYIAAIRTEMRAEHAHQGDSKDFENDTWMLEKKASL